VPGPGEVGYGLFLGGEHTRWGGPGPAAGTAPQHPGLVGMPTCPTALCQLKGFGQDRTGPGGLRLAEQEASLVDESFGPGERRVGVV
jgi:hypothetical protein